MPFYRVIVEARNLPGLLWDEPLARYGFFATRCVEAATGREAAMAAVDAIKSEFREVFDAADEAGLVPELHPDAPELLGTGPDALTNTGAAWFQMDNE